MKIGTDIGKNEYMLNRIMDIELDKEGNIYALDNDYNLVRVYDSEGVFQYNISRSGNGPGELTRGLDINLAENKLFIADLDFGLEVFEKKNDDGDFRFLKRFDLGFQPYQVDYCNNKLFVTSISNMPNNKIDYKKSIHVYDYESQEYLFSFNDSYQSENTMVASKLTRNKIVCNDITNTIVTINNYFPYIKAYDYLGNLRWISMIQDYKYREIVQSEDEIGRATLTINDNQNGFSDYMGAITSFNENIILQVTRLKTLQNEWQGTKTFTYLIDAKNGKGGLISNEVPSFNNILKNNLVGKNFDDDYTSIKLYSFALNN
ncbi:MAG TPA: hypothetical protein VK982_01965 [Bacteroidales bacterium]|nr:hypothetical protein [Bacteroidales bacterium]